MDYQHHKSFFRNVKGKSKTLPWYTYPTIEYLDRLDFSNATLFEYGVGHSTIYWLSRGVGKVVGVENDKKWFNFIKNKILNKAKIVYRRNLEKYANEINNHKHKFDIIVIDGKKRDSCAKKAVNKLVKGGIIILDNSDWFPVSANILRKSGFTQIDFSGFGPGVNFCWTTSVFFKENIKFKYTNDRKKQIPVGGREITVEPE
jgi:hypothetical protein